MSTPNDPLSRQTVESPRPTTATRIIVIRIEPRLLAALGAGLIVLGAFLPAVDPAARAVLGKAEPQLVQDWPSLLIGLITLAVLALPHAGAARRISVPAAVLGLSAAVIAVASAATTVNEVGQVLSRVTDSIPPAAVIGPGVLVTIAGGIVCLITGLSHPPAASDEAQLTLRPGQPAFAVLASAFVGVALLAGLIGARLVAGPGSSGDQVDGGGAQNLLSTPVINAQVTPLGPPEATPETPAPVVTEPPIPTPPAGFPTSTPFVLPTERPTATATLPLNTATPSATFPPSPQQP